MKENEGKGISIVGTDASKAMIKRAHSRCKNLPGVELQVADLGGNLSFPIIPLIKWFVQHALCPGKPA